MVKGLSIAEDAAVTMIPVVGEVGDIYLLLTGTPEEKFWSTLSLCASVPTFGISINYSGVRLATQLADSVPDVARGVDALVDGTKAASKARGNANPIGQQGPFNVTPDGVTVPPIGSFNPGELVQHPRVGNHGKTNYGTVDPGTGKFRETVAVHPKEPGKGSGTHGGQDHYHLNRKKDPIYAPK